VIPLNDKLNVLFLCNNEKISFYQIVIIDIPINALSFRRNLNHVNKHRIQYDILSYFKIKKLGFLRNDKLNVLFLCNNEKISFNQIVIIYLSVLCHSVGI
jgi:hypothetical protein